METDPRVQEVFEGCADIRGGFAWANDNPAGAWKWMKKPLRNIRAAAHSPPGCSHGCRTAHP